MYLISTPSDDDDASVVQMRELNNILEGNERLCLLRVLLSYEPSNT